MADEEIKQQLRDVKGQFTSMERILKEFKADNKKALEERLKANKEFFDNVDNVKGLSERDADKIKRAGMLEQSFGFTREAAIGIAETTKSLNLVTEKMEEIEEFANQTGQDVQNSAEYKQLEAQKKSLEELQKFGRNLSGFEKTFVKFAGGTFEEMKKSLQEGGNLTQQGIFKEGFNDLKGDFDKLLSLFGPLGGFLQQIPLLGTILSFIGRQMKAVIVRLVLAAKARLIDRKKRNAVDAENLRIAKKGLKADEQIARNQVKQTMVQSGTTAASAPDDAPEGDDAQGGGSFRAASIFLGVAAASGVAAGAGLSAAAAGMSAFATAAFKFSGALAVGGLALGVGLTGIFGSFALGDKMGAFEGMKEFGKVNMLKVLGSMLGLATLMGVLGAIVTTGVGALIMGVGAIAVMALIGSLVLIGKGLGEFATSIMPFEQMNVPRMKSNIQQLASISGDIDELMDMSGGRGFIAQTFTDHPLEELAKALGSYAGDMSEKINNITNLKTALKGFEFPELPDGEKGGLFSGDLIRGWTGEDFSGELKKLSKLQLAADLGVKLSSVGDGLLAIGNGLGNITDKKVEHLEAITEALGDMKNVDLNFNASVTPTSVTPTPTNAQSQGQNNNVVVAPQVSNRVSNTTRRFSATGSNMMNHSALHYPSLG